MMKLSCADMGKPECHFVAEGETAEDVKMKLMDHVREMHPDALEGEDDVIINGRDMHELR